MKEAERRILKLAESASYAYGVRIVEVRLTGNLRRPVVKVFIDKDNGVTLNDCETFSRALSAALDVEDPIQRSYVLEVSSPGLDRPLKSVQDFERNRGSLCRIFTKEKIDGRNFFVGRIIDANNETVKLAMEKEYETDIAFNNISRARLEVAV